MGQVKRKGVSYFVFRLENYDQAVDIASNPPLLESNSATEVNEFIKEQRKVIESFKDQPWPMQMKLAAVELVILKAQLYNCISHKSSPSISALTHTDATSIIC